MNKKTKFNLGTILWCIGLWFGINFLSSAPMSWYPIFPIITGVFFLGAALMLCWNRKENVVENE